MRRLKITCIIFLLIQGTSVGAYGNLFSLLQIFVSCRAKLISASASLSRTEADAWDQSLCGQGCWREAGWDSCLQPPVPSSKHTHTNRHRHRHPRDVNLCQPSNGSESGTARSLFVSFFLSVCSSGSRIVSVHIHTLFSFPLMHILANAHTNNLHCKCSACTQSPNPHSHTLYPLYCSTPLYLCSTPLLWTGLQGGSGYFHSPLPPFFPWFLQKPNH